MKITNSLGLPEAIVKAVENDPYSKGDAEFSVTELLSPPRQRALRIAHKEELTEDVKDRLWALYGQIAHLILERANMNDLAEKRLFGEIEGVRVSGQFDTLCIEDGTLSDYKFTTVWGFKASTKPKVEWIAQLNMQLELLRQNGLEAKSLRIVGLLRDWQINPPHDRISARLIYKISSIVSLVLKTIPINPLREIVFLIEEWKKNKQWEKQSYPPHPIAYHDIPLRS